MTFGGRRDSGFLVRVKGRRAGSIGANLTIASAFRLLRPNTLSVLTGNAVSLGSITGCNRAGLSRLLERERGNKTKRRRRSR